MASSRDRSGSQAEEGKAFFEVADFIAEIDSMVHTGEANVEVEGRPDHLVTPVVSLGGGHQGVAGLDLGAVLDQDREHVPLGALGQRRHGRPRHHRHHRATSQRFLRQGRYFYDLLTEHISKENEVLFPMADAFMDLHSGGSSLQILASAIVEPGRAASAASRSVTP